MKTKPNGTMIEYATVNLLNPFEYLLCQPTDWNEDEKPWSRCNIKNIKEITYNKVLTGLSNFAISSP